MNRRIWFGLIIAALLAACGIKLTVERHDKATIEVDPKERLRRRDRDRDEDPESP